MRLQYVVNSEGCRKPFCVGGMRVQPTCSGEVGVEGGPAPPASTTRAAQVPGTLTGSGSGVQWMVIVVWRTKMGTRPGEACATSTP